MSTDPESADVAAILPEPAEVVPEPASGGAFGAPVATSEGGGLPDERPEVLVGGAFLGGFLVAKLLKRLG
jgi:hypothetical protein